MWCETRRVRTQTRRGRTQPRVTKPGNDEKEEEESNERVCCEERLEDVDDGPKDAVKRLEEAPVRWFGSGTGCRSSGRIGVVCVAFSLAAFLHFRGGSAGTSAGGEASAQGFDKVVGVDRLTFVSAFFDGSFIAYQLLILVYESLWRM